MEPSVLSALLDSQNDALCAPWASEKVLYVLIASSGRPHAGRSGSVRWQASSDVQGVWRCPGALDYSCMFGADHDCREVTRSPRLCGGYDEESEESSCSKAAEAVRSVILHGARDARSILAMFNRPDGYIMDLAAMVLPASVPEMPSVKPNLSGYDHILFREGRSL